MKGEKRILLYRIGHFGDTICAIPPMVAVRKRFPKSWICLLTNKEMNGAPDPGEILSGNDFLDEIITYETDKVRKVHYLWLLVRKLRSYRFDLLIYFSLSNGTRLRLIRDWFFFLLTGCRKRIGFELPYPVSNFQTEEGIRIPTYPREVDRLMSLLKPLEIAENEIEFRLPIKDENIAFVDRVWVEYGLLHRAPIIGISPGGKFPVQRWDVERYAIVAKALKRKYDAAIILIGGPGDLEEASKIKSEAGDFVINLVGKTTYMDSAEVVRRCCLLISNDSGPVHVAAAVGTPVIGIYSARNLPETWHPWGSDHTILMNDLPSCRFCQLTVCDTRECIDGITVERVLEATESYLNNV